MQQRRKEKFHKAKQMIANKAGAARKLPIGIQFLLALLVLAAGAGCLMYVMWERGYYASGYDTWGHLFKSDLMYQNILKGNYYPLFSKLWYNGVQPYRYWAPIPYYLLAALQMAAGGDIVLTYYYFVGFAFFTGGLGWLLWGISTRRMVLCSFLSLVWFFLPDNMRVFFFEGNVPRMVAAILIPYLVYFIWLFVQKKKNYAAFFVSLLTALLAMTHLMISAMMGITAFLFLIFYVIGTKNFIKSAEAIVSMLIGYVLTGIWLIPALTGGLITMNSEAGKSVMESLTYSLWSTLNPFTRLVGVTDTYYYGLSIVLICILGVLLANKKQKAGYYTNLLILLCTTPAFIPVLSKLPMNQLLWMMRFTTIAYAFFLWSLIEWKQARRYFTLLLMALLLIDCIPSLSLSRYYYQARGSIVDEMKTTKKITSQRAALMDLSILNSYPSFELCEGEQSKQYTFGWAWQGASTAQNIVMLNTALENKDYAYMFDRSVELGDDTVVVLKELVLKYGGTRQQLLEAAGQSGYQLYSETNEAYILHFSAAKSFGVKTRYKGIAIGEYAGQIAFDYPAFTGGSNNIEDYTVEELSRYETIFLSGFTYNDLETAQEMVTQLADQGVRVVIDMTHIPVVKENKRMYFLGVAAQDIEFDTTYPTLTYKDTNYYPQTFPEEYGKWNTKYLEGVKNVLGYSDYYGQKLTFAGTNDNQNIIFLGYNLMFYYQQTKDTNVTNIIDDCLNLKLHGLPERSIVPISVQYTDKKIIIDTPVSNVNTTIAYQDNFLSEDGIMNHNNLLYVTKKHTEITLVYPYLRQGLLVSEAGTAALIIWLITIAELDRRRRRKQTQGDKDNAKAEGNDK